MKYSHVVVATATVRRTITEYLDRLMSRSNAQRGTDEFQCLRSGDQNAASNCFDQLILSVNFPTGRCHIALSIPPLSILKQLNPPFLFSFSSIFPPSLRALPCRHSTIASHSNHLTELCHSRPTTPPPLRSVQPSL